MKKIITFIFCLLFGLMFINAGLNKFFNYLPPPDDLPENVMKAMLAFMEIGWLMPLVGFAEVIGGLLFIIPKTRALGAIIIFPIMIGITINHVTIAPAGLPIALVLLAINLVIIYQNKKKYLPMVTNP